MICFRDATGGMSHANPILVAGICRQRKVANPHVRRVERRATESWKIHPYKYSNKSEPRRSPPSREPEAAALYMYMQILQSAVVYFIVCLQYAIDSSGLGRSCQYLPKRRQRLNLLTNRTARSSRCTSQTPRFAPRLIARDFPGQDGPSR